LKHQAQPIVIDQNHYHSISTVARLREIALTYLEHFATRLNSRNQVFQDDRYLVVAFDQERGHVDLRYAGVNIRFLLVVGLSHSAPVAKVQCLYRFDANDELHTALLGEFVLQEGGRTNLIDHAGQPYFTHNGADLIAAFYLSKAFEKSLIMNVATQPSVEQQ
jgi:hypothetical protein